MLKFESMHLVNWRNFHDVTIDFQDRLFIVGANASGKTNLLDALRFLHDIIRNGLQKAVKYRGGIRKLINVNACENEYIEIGITLQDEGGSGGDAVRWSYTLRFHAAEDALEEDVSIVLEHIAKNRRLLLARSCDLEGENHLTRQFTHLEQPAIGAAYRELYSCLRSISYVNIIPQLIRDSGAYVQSAEEEDFFGSKLMENIATIPQEIRTGRLEKISRVLQLAVSQFVALEFFVDGKGKPHLQARYNHFRAQGGRVREDQFSDGTLRLIGILWAVLEGEGLLLLEEPELYLHSELVKQLPVFIANVQSRPGDEARQVIISSHSYDLLNNETIDVSEIAILDASGAIRRASEIEAVNAKIDAGYTPAEAVIPQLTPKGIMEGQLTILDLL